MVCVIGVEVMGSKNLFLKRYEVKYLLNSEQYRRFNEMAMDKLLPDKYPVSNISNIYFDTPDFLLIRRSMDKPVVYKEKLRLRTYLTPNDTTKAFCEIKKKYKGIVYKRRISMDYSEAYNYLKREGPPKNECQISKEIDWMFKYYEGLAPAMYISYDRNSYFGADENEEIRLTFDKNITWRVDDLDQRLGSYGNKLLPEDIILMELKIPGAIPLWFTKILDELKIYPASFSKYGSSFRVYTGHEQIYSAFVTKI